MKKLLLTTTVIAGVALSASAATEAGKMYVRGDAGYQFGSSKTNSLEAIGATSGAKRLTGFTGDVGFGYAIADNIRTDLTVNFSNPSSKQTNKLATNAAGADQKIVKYVDADAVAKAGAAKKAADAVLADAGDNATQAQKDAATTANTALTKAQNGTSLDLTQNHTANVKNKNIGFLANVYYDVATGSAFTPYVMGGVGLDRTKQETAFSGQDAAGTAVGFKIKYRNKNSFAYQVGLGVGFEAAKDVVLDVGYRLSGHSGNEYVYKIKQGGSFTYGKATNVYDQNNDFKTKAPKVTHSLTAGVRFAF